MKDIGSKAAALLLFRGKPKDEDDNEDEMDHDVDDYGPDLMESLWRAQEKKDAKSAYKAFKAIIECAGKDE